LIDFNDKTIQLESNLQKESVGQFCSPTKGWFSNTATNVHHHPKAQGMVITVNKQEL